MFLLKTPLGKLELAESSPIKYSGVLGATLSSMLSNALPI